MRVFKTSTYFNALWAGFPFTLLNTLQFDELKFEKNKVLEIIIFKYLESILIKSYLKN